MATETAMRGALPKDDRYWRIEWVGGVYRNHKVPSEMQVEIVIAPLVAVAEDDNPTVDEAFKTNPKERRTIRVGVGTIPSLIVGSIWKHRRMLPVVPYTRRSFRVNLAAENMQLLQTGYTYEPKKWLIPLYKYSVPPSLLDTRCAAVSIQTDSHALIIPCFEVVRSWLLRSTAMANTIFSGTLNTIRDKIYDTKKSGVIDGRWRVQLRTGFGESDVWPAALMACDPEAFRRASKVFDSIIRHHVTGVPVHIEMLPPSCRGTLTARGVDISTKDHKRFLVFDLLEIPFPEPDDDILWDIDNTNTGEKDDEDSSGDGWNQQPSSRKAQEKHVVDHDEEPDNKGGTTREEYQPPALSIRTKLERIEGERKVKSGASPGAEPPPDSDKHSSGKGTHGQTSSTRFILVASTDMPTTPAPRKAVGFDGIAVIRSLLNRYPQTTCTAVPASDRTVRYQDGVRSVFPTVILERKHAWSFVGAELRQAVVLEIQHEGLYGYAIEIERRPAPDGADTERFRLGFISATGQTQIGADGLKKVLKNCAQARGVWPEEGGKIEGHDLAALKHTRTPEVFARLLLDLLRERAGRPALGKDIFVAQRQPSTQVSEAGEA